jgi:hypothetical protein
MARYDVPDYSPPEPKHPMGTSATQTIDPSVMQVLQSVLKMLESGPPPAPPVQGPPLSGVQSGAQAFGEFRNRIRGFGRRPEDIYREDLKKYQEQMQEREAAAAELRNKFRVGMATEAVEQAGAEKVAGIRASAAAGATKKSDYTAIGPDGKPHKYTRFFAQDGTPMKVVDPRTNEAVDAIDNGIAAYADIILPAVPGQSPAVRVPRSGPYGDIEQGHIPPPPAGTAKEAKTALSMKVLYKDALSSYRSYIGNTSKLKRSTTSAGRNVPILGGAIEEFALSYSDPEGVDLSRKIDNLADILLRLRSGAQINPDEYKRLRSLLPKLGENPQTALLNFERFDTELLTALRNNYALAPSLFTPELLQDLGLTMQDLGGPANRATPGSGPTAPGGSTDPAVQEYQQYLENLKKERQGAQPTP